MPRAQAKRGADRVERRIAAADDGNVFAREIDHGFVVSWKFVGMHQVDARQKFIGGVDAIQVLAGNTHELRQPGAGPDEDRVDSLLLPSVRRW